MLCRSVILIKLQNNFNIHTSCIHTLPFELYKKQFSLTQIFPGTEQMDIKELKTFKPHING